LVNLGYDFSEILTDSDVLLIVPPFANFNKASLALHILQACAKKEGFSANVLYANLALVSYIGENIYDKIVGNYVWGEFLFTSSAYGVPFENSNDIMKEKFNNFDFLKIGNSLNDWVCNIINEVLKKRYRVIGCTTGFVQTNASISLLNHIKMVRPEIVTVIGGPSCHGELAEGILSLSNNIDYAFSGESEIAFPSFLKDIFGGYNPKNKIIPGKVCSLDEIPVCDYSDYIRQLEYFLPKSRIVEKKSYQLTYETSRGCWWGQKHRCYFCGLTGEVYYREKSPQKVLDDLDYISEKYNPKFIFMTDSIMPYSYFAKLLPSMIERNYQFKFFYEIKSNLTFEQLILLKKAGVANLQPGIESLSTSLLKRMNKGVLARQNVSLLKNNRCLQIETHWNILTDFPNDTEMEYKEMLSIIQLIFHLEAPVGCGPIAITRFSEYYNHPEKFGIINIRPNPNIHQNPFPEENVSQVCQTFTGDYQCYSRNDNTGELSVMKELKNAVDKWKTSWRNLEERRQLRLARISKEKYILVDTRDISQLFATSLSEKQAKVILLDWPVDCCDEFLEEITWGLKNKLLIELDKWYISLVTAKPELIWEFKKSQYFKTIDVAARESRDLSFGSIIR
jgi:ribosomal peptide maturation radical SAM protein 1